MNKLRTTCGGFTLTEVIFSVFLFTLASAGVYKTFIQTALNVKAGNSQASFVAMGRSAEQKILKYIQQARAVAPQSTYLDIMTTDSGIARIYFEDMDGNPYTAEDNFLRYKANYLDNNSPVETLCGHVSFLDGEMFRNLSIDAQANSVQVSFHVGDGWSYQDTDTYGTGAGYQGVEVRFSATPRNVQFLYR
ncbi:MAG TPA: hypothetical protein DCZ95_17240 [Verrucomicrobia bacterium]|nr:MAG: hypothetical protein A2X46_09720 [Lentisphaerae bacterium GWF2_57_35]HBA85830.1 hypothetical protein [Verrucomicrobiota bacterium]